MKKPKPELAGPMPKAGQPFNPSYKICGFHPPEIVRRRADLKQGPKLLCQCAVHWAGIKGAFWYGFESLARELGYSIRQAKRDMRTLERKGLLSHVRRGNGQTNKYQFLWHEMFDAEVPDTAHQPDGKRPGDPEDETGPEVPNAARLEVPNPVSRCATIGTLISKGIHSSESVHEANDKADYGFASAKTAEDSPRASSSLSEGEKLRPAHPDLGKVPEVAAEDQNQPMKTRTKPDQHWTDLDITNVGKWVSVFMNGEPPPPALVSWVIQFSTERSLRASDIHRALDTAWRRAAPGRQNAPRSWNWFYEVLRAAFIPGYDARLSETPAATHPSHQASSEEVRGIEALELPDAPDSLVASYRCKCGAEIRQYQNRVDGTCTCSHAKPATRATITEMPVCGIRRGADPLRRKSL
jgi:hypothetical protein